MSTLISEGEDEPRLLEWFCNTFVGRRMVGGLNCDWGRPIDREVSSIHAALTWNRRVQQWQVHDLGSVNGTFVDGQPLEGTEARTIRRGSLLEFGGAKWRVDEVSPPPAGAVSSRGERHLALDDVLLLPNDEQPEYVIHRVDDQWCLHPWSGEVPSSAEGGETLEPGHTVTAGARTWTVSLPVDGRLRTDMGTVRSTRRLADFKLVVDVSPDYETFHARLKKRAESHLLPHRRYHELWWLLAEARLKDAAADTDEAEAGWVACEELISQLGIQATGGQGTLNVWVHRSRQRLKAAGFIDATNFIERRSGTVPMMRIGLGAIEIAHAQAGEPAL